MELSLLVINFLSVGYVCLLPFIFFRKDGTFNLLWLLTASPYVCYEIFFLSAYYDLITLFDFGSQTQTIFNVVSVVFAALGIAVIAATMGSHRVPLALWHQKNDDPVNIIKHGPYSLVRHPFYTAFILIMTGGFLGFPHIISAGLTIYGLIILTLTAQKEEKKLSQSEFGADYIGYMEKTGRFFPKFF